MSLPSLERITLFDSEPQGMFDKSAKFDAHVMKGCPLPVCASPEGVLSGYVILSLLSISKYHSFSANGPKNSTTL